MFPPLLSKRALAGLDYYRSIVAVAPHPTPPGLSAVETLRDYNNNNNNKRIYKVVTSEALEPGSVLVSRGRRESLREEECL